MVGRAALSLDGKSTVRPGNSTLRVFDSRQRRRSASRLRD